MKSTPLSLRKLSRLIAFILLVCSLTVARAQVSVGGGTLSWTISSTVGRCGIEGDSSYTQSTESSFKFTYGGTTYSLSGSSTELSDPTSGSNCPSSFPWTPASLSFSLPSNVDPGCSIAFTVPSGPASLVCDTTGTLDPLYKVTSILYDPPGDESQAGYTNATTNGTTTSIGSSFSAGSSVTYTSGSWLTGGSISFGFGFTATTGESTAATELFTDAEGVSIANQNTNPDAINHDQDIFLIWLNPEVDVVFAGSTPVSYALTTQKTSAGALEDTDIVEVSAGVMEANASGVTTVPAPILNQQNGMTLPGLAAICKNLKTAEYTAGTCTLADQCGCTPADFAPILALDPLLNYNSTTYTATPYAGSVNPLSLDTSGVAGCTSPTTSDKCRYVPVTSSPGGNQVVVTLSGPDAPGYSSAGNTFSLTDSDNTVQTYSESLDETVTYTAKADFIIGSIAVADQWKWSESESVGEINTTADTATVTLNTTTTGCYQDINVFEDTVYHTFVFQQPSPTSSQGESCTTVLATPTFSPAAGTYASAQTVTIADAANGVTIYYTTNGTSPTTSSTKYTGPITVSSSETVKAIAVATSVSGWAPSAVGSAAYTIE
jgi:hypothetical protein